MLELGIFAYEILLEYFDIYIYIYIKTKAEN